MITENKQKYETPATVVVEIKTEGIICGSEIDDLLDDYEGGDPLFW